MVLWIFLIISLHTCTGQFCLNKDDSEDPQPNLCSSFSAAAIDLRVVGGASINATDAPWHTIVTRKGNGKVDSKNILGGGSLITPTLVLTAAHLFWTNSRDGHVCPQPIRELDTAEDCHGLKGGCPKGCHRVTTDSVELFFGITTVVQDSSSPYTIDNIEIHWGYNKQSISNDVADGHDIAIVRTNKEVVMSPTIQTSCLPQPELEEKLTVAETDVSINGFGRDGRSGRLLAANLQQGCLHLVQSSSCHEAYRPVTERAPYLFPDGEITGDQLCALGEGVDSCQGDSGGGLILNTEGTNTIIGVTSLGSTSCRSSIPGLYTNVFSHLDWIQQQIATESCSSWSVCNATCNTRGYQVRTCLGVQNDGRPWYTDESQACYEVDCIDMAINNLESERLVVLGGWVGNVTQSNTVFMETCPVQGSQIPDMPRNISHGVGAFLPSEKPLIIFCGGWIRSTGPTSECFEYKMEIINDIREEVFAEPSEWEQIEGMHTPRANAALTVIGNNKVWITGGRSSKKVVLDSTEILEKVGDVWTVNEGPKLTEQVASHCVVTDQNEDGFFIYIIGGAYFDSKTRKFVMRDNVNVYDIYEDKVSSFLPIIPNLNTARSGHACTLVTDSDKQPLGLMVAGGQKATKEMLDSVEYLELRVGGEVWKELASLPRKLTGAKMVMKHGLPVLIGGTGFMTEDSSRSQQVSDLSFSKDIISYNNSAWKKIGEVVETVAYHQVLALDSDLCLEIKLEIREDMISLDNNEFNPDDFIDIR